jgi:hypothetical protein
MDQEFFMMHHNLLIHENTNINNLLKLCADKIKELKDDGYIETIYRIEVTF